MSDPGAVNSPRIPASDDRAPFPIDEWPYLVMVDRLEVLIF